MPLDISERARPAIGERIERAATIVRASGVDSAARRVTFIASDETVDRYGDIIRASGWELTNFIRNPVLLFGHKSGEPPIGTVPDVHVEGTRLIAVAEFASAELSPFAETIFRMVEAGIISAVSVGFLPTAEPNIMRDAEDRFTGFEFIAQELLELSVVSVPANPAALALARGLDLEAQRRLFGTDERAAARIAGEQRRRSIALARLRPGHFGG